MEDVGVDDEPSSSEDVLANEENNKNKDHGEDEEDPRVCKESIGERRLMSCAHRVDKAPSERHSKDEDSRDGCDDLQRRLAEAQDLRDVESKEVRKNPNGDEPLPVGHTSDLSKGNKAKGPDDSILKERKRINRMHNKLTRPSERLVQACVVEKVKTEEGELNKSQHRFKDGHEDR